jgi:hypothetical protein
MWATVSVCASVGAASVAVEPMVAVASVTAPTVTAGFARVPLLSIAGRVSVSAALVSVGVASVAVEPIFAAVSVTAPTVTVDSDSVVVEAMVDARSVTGPMDSDGLESDAVDAIDGVSTFWVVETSSTVGGCSDSVESIVGVNSPSAARRSSRRLIYGPLLLQRL